MSIKCNQVLVFFLGIFILSACASSNISNELEEKKVMIRAPLDGIWVGEFDIRGRGPYDFTAVHLQDKAYAYSLKAKAMCVGTLSFDGEHLLNKYVLFALDGGPFDWANLTGTVKDNEQGYKTISSYFKTLNGGDTGRLTISYSGLYDQSSSLDNVKGDWTYTDRDDLATAISISEAGVLAGDDSDGCTYLGYVDIINPKYNMYHVKVEVTECDSVNDEYEGVAFLADQILTMQVASKKYALYFAFE